MLNLYVHIEKRKPFDHLFYPVPQHTIRFSFQRSPNSTTQLRIQHWDGWSNKTQASNKISQEDKSQQQRCHSLLQSELRLTLSGFVFSQPFFSPHTSFNRWWWYLSLLPAESKFMQKSCMQQCKGYSTLKYGNSFWSMNISDLVSDDSSYCVIIVLCVF